MARKRASMREGPLAELFRATEAAQEQAEHQEVDPPPTSSDQERLVLDETVEYTPDFAQPKAEEPKAEEPQAEPEPQAEVAVAPKPKPKPVEPPPADGTPEIPPATPADDGGNGRR